MVFLQFWSLFNEDDERRRGRVFMKRAEERREGRGGRGTGAARGGRRMVQGATCVRMAVACVRAYRRPLVEEKPRADRVPRMLHGNSAL